MTNAYRVPRERGMSDDDVSTWAQKLDDARRAAAELGRISTEREAFTMEDAYAIHDAGIRLRVQDGEQVVGYKMGLTSEAKRKQMGLSTSIYGTLTDRMLVSDTYSLAGTIHPKAEPEIAFRTRSELKGEPTLEEVKAAVSGVAAAIEILDSRFVGFKYFSLHDVIADNASSSHLVVGPWLEAHTGVTLADVNMHFSINGNIVETAKGNAISGDPWLSLAQLVSLLSSRGQSLPANSLVLAGAATTAVALEHGMSVSLLVDELPPVEFRVA